MFGNVCGGMLPIMIGLEWAISLTEYPKLCGNQETKVVFGDIRRNGVVLLCDHIVAIQNSKKNPRK